MIKPFKHRESHLEVVMDNVLTELESMKPKDSDYEKVVDAYRKLAGTRECEVLSRPSPDAILSAIVTVGGILAVMLFESRDGILTTKAWPFATRSLGR